MEQIKSLSSSIIQSKYLRLALSVFLIFLAFRRIEIGSLLTKLTDISVYFLVLMILLNFVVIVIGGWRWSLLILKQPKLSDIFVFAKANFIGGFYNLFFPTGVAGDLIKWTSLQKRYPQIPKSKLLGSSLLDRVVGFTAFIIVAFGASLLASVSGYEFPSYLMVLFSCLFIGVLGFFAVINLYQADKWLDEYPRLKKLDHIIELVKDENKVQIAKAIGVAFITEFAWITPIWFISMELNAGIGLLPVYIFMPVISLILILPVSVAGFGAREALFLYFFSQTGASDINILAVSTLMGLLGLVNSALGGIFLLF